MSENRQIEVSPERCERKDQAKSGSLLESAAPAPTTRILIADDHAVIRLGIVALLETQPGFEVVGQAANCRECCEKVTELHPDVLIVDLEMEDCSGSESLKKLAEVSTKARAVVFSAHVNEVLVSEVMKAGAWGYVPKSASSLHLIEAVKTVSSGGAYLDPSTSYLVINKLSAEDSRDPLTTLSSRENSVLQLLAEGKRNKEIAVRLFISERTVKFHVSSLMQKLDAGNRTEAVTIAIERGLVGC